MFSFNDYPNNPHGATTGSTNATLDGFELSLFSGTEGPEVANQLCSAIQITLGRMNALSFLSTPRKNLLAQISHGLKSESSCFSFSPCGIFAKRFSAELREMKGRSCGPE